jgi:hypothetical protein
MWFAIAQIATQAFGQMRAEERQKVDDAYRQQLLSLSAEQERVNAEAQVAQRTNEYNKVMEAQDLIFGMQGRKEEGSVSAIQNAGEQAYERDVSLIRAAGASRSQMRKAGAAGEALANQRVQQAQRNQLVSNAIQTIGQQVK